MGNCIKIIEKVEKVDLGVEENKRLNTHNTHKTPTQHNVKLSDIENDDSDLFIPPIEYRKVPDENISIKDCEEYIIPLHVGRVGKVYDVDTITIMFYFNGTDSNCKLYKKSCRIFGIDGPEMKTKNRYEKKIALKGQQFLENLLLGEVVTLKNNKNDKYGRILADVYLGDVKISDVLLEQKYAVKYDGKKKRSPKNWERFHMQGRMK